MKKTKKNQSGEKEAADPDSEGTTDLALIMASIPKSEALVISTIDSRVASLSRTLNEKIDSISTDL